MLEFMLMQLAVQLVVVIAVYLAVMAIAEYFKIPLFPADLVASVLSLAAGAWAVGASIPIAVIIGVMTSALWWIHQHYGAKVGFGAAVLMIVFIAPWALVVPVPAQV